MKKILIISASGMGCTVMFTPTLKAIRDAFPDAKISFLGINKSFVEPVRGSELVDEVLVFDFAKTSLFNLSKLARRLRYIANLRKRKYDISVTVFPSNKWFFNVFAWMVGARKRISHAYSTPSIKTFAWLQNVKVKANPKIHDVEQNLNLLTALGVRKPDVDPKLGKPELYFHVSGDYKTEAKQYFAKRVDQNKKIVGMHIGSSQDYVMAAKRWPTEHFAELADRIQSELDAQVVVFAGPDEIKDVEEMKRLMKTDLTVIKKPLPPTAVMIELCDLFVSNDSGPMHIAVAMKTPVVAIWGPTKLSRTRPWGMTNIICGGDTEQSLNYPFYTTKAVIKKTDPVLVEPARVCEEVKEQLSKKM